MEKLKVGDKIYPIEYNKILTAFTVQRVTKTLAVCEFGTKFKIEYSDPSCINTVGYKESCDTRSYSLETPELIDKFYKQKAIQKIRDTKL